MPRKKVTFDTVREIGLALPDVEEGTTYGTPALKVRGAMFTCIPSNKSAEPDSLVLLIPFDMRDELVAAEPQTYYFKEHYADYACVLVRLKRIHPDALRDLLTASWRFVSAKARPRRTTRRASAKLGSDTHRR